MAGIPRLIAIAAGISRVVLAALAAALLAAAALLRARLSLTVIVLRMLLATLLTTLVLATLLATLLLITLVLVRHNTLANNFDGFTIGAGARAECQTNGTSASVLAYVQPELCAALLQFATVLRIATARPGCGLERRQIPRIRPPCYDQRPLPRGPS